MESSTDTVRPPEAWLFTSPVTSFGMFARYANSTAWPPRVRKPPLLFGLQQHHAPSAPVIATGLLSHEKFLAFVPDSCPSCLVRPLGVSVYVALKIALIGSRGSRRARANGAQAWQTSPSSDVESCQCAATTRSVRPYAVNFRRGTRVASLARLRLAHTLPFWSHQ